MLESGPSGSVRGVPSNGHPYRDPRPIPDIGPLVLTGCLCDILANMKVFWMGVGSCSLV